MISLMAVDNQQYIVFPLCELPAQQNFRTRKERKGLQVPEFVFTLLEHMYC